MAEEEQIPDITMNADDLWREEAFTDRRVGTIRRLTPVKGDGEPDPGRAVRYLGETQLMTPAGALPINFEIEAKSLTDAAGKFGDEAQEAVKDTMERLKEMRREQASSLYVPDGGQGGGMGGPGGMGGGHGGGGGGIQMP